MGTLPAAHFAISVRIKLRPGPIAANHNHLRALLGKQQGSRQPEAACRSRDEDGLSAHRYPAYL